MRLKKILLLHVVLVLIGLSGCSILFPQLMQDSSYINYNNYDTNHRKMEIADNTLYLISEDFNYIDSVFQVNKEGRKTICSGIEGEFVKNGKNIYFWDYDQHLKKTNLDTGETIDIFDGLRNGLFLIYQENVIACDGEKMFLVHEDRENECLLEGKIDWIGATENLLYAVVRNTENYSEDSFVWSIDLSAKKSFKVGIFPKRTDNVDFVVSNNYLVGHMSGLNQIISMDLRTGLCQEHEIPHTLYDMNAGRNDVLYFICCEENEYGQAKQSKDDGLYRLDLASGKMKLIDQNVDTSAILYIFDDEWIYVSSEGSQLFFGTEEVDRVAVDGSKREHIYTAGFFNSFF